MELTLKSKLFAWIVVLTLSFSTTTYAKCPSFELAKSEIEKREQKLYSEASQAAAKGWPLLYQLRYEEAISYFNTAIEMAPDYSQYLYWRGRAFALNMQYQEAIEDFTKGISIEEQDIKEGYRVQGFLQAFYFGRSMALHCLGNKKASLEDLKTSARLGSNEAQVALWGKGISW